MFKQKQSVLYILGLEFSYNYSLQYEVLKNTCIWKWELDIFCIAIAKKYCANFIITDTNQLTKTYQS